MKSKTAVLGLLCVVATLGSGPGAWAGGAKTAAAPRVRDFSPAAIHPGGEFLIDADFDGARPPRVWVGKYAVPRSRVRIAHDLAPSGARRLWAQAPKRVRVGEYAIKIATRSGAALAAKTIVVASCNAAPVTPAGCGDEVPADGAALSVSGAKGYGASIQLGVSSSIAAETDDPGKSFTNACNADFQCLTIRMTTADFAEAHVGSLTTIGLNYYDGKTGNQWTKEPGGAVRVVAASPTSVGLCFDAVLTFMGHNPGTVPLTVTVKGYLVIKR